jgi:hypothetical protein
VVLKFEAEVEVDDSDTPRPREDEELDEVEGPRRRFMVFWNSLNSCGMYRSGVIDSEPPKAVENFTALATLEELEAVTDTVAVEDLRSGSWNSCNSCSSSPQTGIWWGTEEGGCSSRRRFNRLQINGMNEVICNKMTKSQ